MGTVKAPVSAWRPRHRVPHAAYRTPDTFERAYQLVAWRGVVLAVPEHPGRHPLAKAQTGARSGSASDAGPDLRRWRRGQPFGSTSPSSDRTARFPCLWAGCLRQDRTGRPMPLPPRLRGLSSAAVDALPAAAEPEPGRYRPSPRLHGEGSPASEKAKSMSRDTPSLHACQHGIYRVALGADAPHEQALEVLFTRRSHQVKLQLEGLPGTALADNLARTPDPPL